MRQFLRVAERAAAAGFQGGEGEKGEEGRQAVRAQAAALAEPAADAGGPQGAGIEAGTKAGGEEADDLFGAGVEEFGEVHDLVVGHGHFAGNAGMAGGPGFQVGHTDHVVIGHRIGDVFGGLAGQGVVLGGQVEGEEGFDAAEVVGAIGEVLKINDLLQAGAGEFGHGGRQAVGAGGEGLPCGQKARGAGRA